MDMFDWKIIKTLYELRNITNTAKVLYISQPALTGRIKKIEKCLGVKLINSSNKGITFTHAGKYAAEYATGCLTSFELFMEKLSNMEVDVSGTLRIGSPSIIARYYIPLLIQKFKEMYPKVTFEVTIENSSEVLAHTKDGTFHFGFLREDFGWDDGVKKLLTINHLCAVSKTKFELNDLPYMSRIDYQTDSYFRNFLDNWWSGRFEEQPNIIMQVSNIDLCKEMVFSGVGYGLLPSIVLSDHPEVYQVPLCDSKGELIRRKTWIVGRNSALQRKLPATFYNFIQTCHLGNFLRRY